MTDGDSGVYAASAWILRGGVVSSVSTMILGIARSFREGGLTVNLMEHRRFQADLGAIARGAARLEGLALIELGILLLVLTPVLRVATAMVLFAREDDRLYAAISAVVLALTLSSLLLAR